MTDESKKPLKLFYCYARQDKALRDELDIHLAGLRRLNFITSWYDGEISPGVNWKKKIDTQLREAHIILLLITPHFIHSDYCYGIEMKRALERHEVGTARVIPIIMRLTHLWEKTPFGSLQALPADARPVIQWGNRDEAFYNIAEGVHKAIAELLNQLKTAEAERQANIEAQRIKAVEGARGQPPQWALSSMAPAFSGGRIKASPLSLAASVTCPNCGFAVKPDDNFCPNCRIALSPSESDYHIRATKPPLPPVQQAPAPFTPSRSIAEQPTLDMLSAIPNGQVDPEKTVLYGFASQSVQGQRLGIAVGTRSDPGIKRKFRPNQDSLFAARGQRKANTEKVSFGLFVVADGGNGPNGQDASRSAIQTIIDFMLPKLSKTMDPYSKDLEQLLATAVQHANQVVHQHNMELRADMGTTVTATLIVGTTAYISNVGDSRTYLYCAPYSLKKVTNDHSVAASLVEAGIIRPDDIYTHPKRNQIYRKLGEKASVEVDSFVVHLHLGDKLLLCSDGLWDMVRDPMIEGILKSTVPDPMMTADALIKAALDGGGEDNVSVIVISLTDPSQHTIEYDIELFAKPDAVQMPQL